MKIGVIKYEGGWNVGDAAQTIALLRLLPPVSFTVNRDSLSSWSGDDGLLVANGYMSSPLKEENRGVYAGIYLNPDQRNQSLDNLNSIQIGARDPFTNNFLKSRGIDSDLVGCATCTLPRFEGERNGRAVIDIGGYSGDFQTSNIIPQTSWESLWRHSMNRLRVLARAEEVITSRLHVALPCLAFGTPVKIPYSEFRGMIEPERLSILTEMGFEYDRWNVINMEPFARRFMSFLLRKLPFPLHERDLEAVEFPS